MRPRARATPLLAATILVSGCERVQPVPSSDVGADAVAARAAADAGPVEVAVETS